MQPKLTKSKTQLLDWLNQYFTNYYCLSPQNCQQVRSYIKHPLSKIQQLGNGIAYLLLLHSININSVPIRKIEFKPKNQYDNLSNLKLLDVGLGKAGIKKTIDITKLAKMKTQDNLEMLQWFEKYIEINVGTKRYLTKIDTNQSIGTSQNQTNKNIKNDKNCKSNADYKQSDIHNNNNIQHFDKKMKLAVLQYPQNNQVKPIKIIKEPNPQQLRKNILQKHLKKLKPITSSSNSVKIQDEQKQKLLPSNNSNQSCSKIQLGQTSNYKKVNQMQLLLAVSGKRQIQDDYQKQLKRVTVQMNNHQIIDEITDIIYVKNQQKEINSEKKLAKIQNILLKNGYGYGSRKQNKINTKTKQKQMISQESTQSQRKQQYLLQKIHQQRQLQNQKSSQTSNFIQQQNKYQIVVINSSSSNPQQNNQRKQLHNQVSQHLQHKNEIQTALKNHKSPDNICLQTPTFTNENLLEESQEKKVFSNRKSSLKREDLLYLQLQGQHLKLLESKKENNTVLNNSDINKF